jgi:hypothetical protein
VKIAGVALTVQRCFIMTGNMEKTDNDIEECLLPQDSEDRGIQRSKSLHRTGSLQRKRWFQRPTSSFANRRESRSELPSTAEVDN